MKYELYDLTITTAGDPTTFNCSHVVGQGLSIKGENMSLLQNTTAFSHYVLASLIPYIAAKQRANSTKDWMYYESQFACPDPRCGAVFVIQRTKMRTYTYNSIKTKVNYAK